MKSTQWNKWHNYILFELCGLYLFFPFVKFFAFGAILSIAILWMVCWKEISHLNPAGGWANRVTLFRFLLLITTVLLSNHIEKWELVVLLSVVVALDGFDGYLARKYNQITSFGTLFDMETDALFVCLVSCLLMEQGYIGSWILIPAFLKYVYFVFTDLTHINRLPEPRTRFGATIAVIMFIGLLMTFVLPENIRQIPALIGAVLVCFSFGVSLVRQIWPLRNVYKLHQ